MKKKIWLILLIIGVIPFALALIVALSYANSGMRTSFIGGIIFFSYLFWPLYIIGLIFILASFFIRFKNR